MVEMKISKATLTEINVIKKQKDKFGGFYPFPRAQFPTVPVTFVAKQGKKVIGFIQIVALGRDLGELSSIGTEQTFRNKGIAKKLMKHAEAHFQGEGIKLIGLTTGKNAMLTKPFFRNRGFRERKRKGFGHTGSTHNMLKHLK